MERIFLSRRNLLTLLSKLDRRKEGEDTTCSLVKYDDKNGKYSQTMPAIMIEAVEDSEYYKDREAGPTMEDLTAAQARYPADKTREHA